MKLRVNRIVKTFRPRVEISEPAEPNQKIRQIDGKYVKSAKDFVLGWKFQSQKSLQKKIRQFDEIFGK